jgi:aminoglycoside phosphotransferase (APT) family kinase protein
MAVTPTTEPPVEAGSDLDVDALQLYLARHIPHLATLDVRLIAGGRSNPTYAVDAGPHAWILRRPPHGLVLETAHDMAREYRVMSALGSSRVPVPRMVHYCPEPDVIGAPFYLMDRLDGRTIRSVRDAAALDEDERHRLSVSMLDTLAALHSVDPAEVGLVDFGRPDGYLSRQLYRWRKQWDAAHTVHRPHVDELLGMLESHLPETTRTGVVHGDYKVDNLMVSHDDPGTVLGLLDWEMSTLGDTLADVGLMLSFWDEEGQPFNPLTNGVTARPGFPSAQQMLAGYADRVSLADTADVDWYVSLADFKIAVIFEQIHVRHLSGQTRGEGFDGMGDMVDPLLERALSRLVQHP